MRLCLRIAFVRAGMLRDGRCVELLRELAPQPRDASLGFFRELLLLHAIVNGLHRLAHAEFKVLYQPGKLLIQLAHLRLPLLQPFRFQPLLLSLDFALTLTQCRTFAVRCSKVCMQPVKEVGNVLCLRRELRDVLRQ